MYNKGKVIRRRTLAVKQFLVDDAAYDTTKMYFFNQGVIPCAWGYLPRKRTGAYSKSIVSTRTQALLETNCTGPLELIQASGLFPRHELLVVQRSPATVQLYSEIPLQPLPLRWGQVLHYSCQKYARSYLIHSYRYIYRSKSVTTAFTQCT